ncbi:MAG: fibronectin type III domain-containing protein [Chloroflexota bacterium]
MSFPAISGTCLRTLFALAVAGTLLLPGCSGDRPLPAPEITDITYIEAEGDTPDTFVLKWEPLDDNRIEGYAIYRAEEGLGPDTGTKSEFELEAVTIALQYKDDELRVTERYPRMRYYYRIAAVTEDGQHGPMSEEVSEVFDPSAP